MADWDEAFDWADEPAPQHASRDPNDPEPGLPLQVWPENWGVVCLFDKCSTQWRVNHGPGGTVLGLDYPGVEVVMRHNRNLCPDRAMAFEQLQQMELAARHVLNV